MNKTAVLAWREVLLGNTDYRPTYEHPEWEADEIGEWIDWDMDEDVEDDDGTCYVCAIGALMAAFCIDQNLPNRFSTINGRLLRNPCFIEWLGANPTNKDIEWPGHVDLNEELLDYSTRYESGDLTFDELAIELENRYLTKG